VALKKPEQIIALADQISACADLIHKRLITAIKKKKITSDEAWSVFRNETILHEYANSLYIDAAIHIINELEKPQEEVTGLIDSAKEKIEKIEGIASFIDLVADLVVFAAAVYTKKPAPILAALEEIKNDVEALSEE